MANSLTHHGILGQRWGVRRTPEQLGHKTGSTSASSDKSKKKNAEQSNNRHGKTSRMTDEELRQRIQRLNMEEQYANLVARAKERDTSTLRKLAGNALESFGKQSFDFVVKWAVDKIFSKKDPDEALRKEVERLRLEDSREELLGKKASRGDSLKREVDRLSLEDRRAELLGKKHERDNPKPTFDISKWRDADVRTMDAETAQNVARWYANAKLITSGREALKPKDDDK